MFDDDESPILLNVEEARKYAKMGRYEASLKSYACARDLIGYEQKSCRLRQENDKWSTLIKDIVSEEVKIRRIRKYMDDIIFQLNIEDTKRQLQIEKKQDQQHAKPDFVLQGKQSNRRINPSPVVKKPRRSPNIGSPVKPPVHQNQRKSHSPGKIADNKNDQDINSQAKTPIDNSDPLVQQITSLGILDKDPEVTWDSISGLSTIKKNLRQNLVILPMRPDIARGLLSPWRSVLLYGPPGTGKTYLAKAVASECHRTFFNVTAAALLSRFHGESEKLVSKLFEVAVQLGPSTIFFDEVDALASRRGGQSESESGRRVKSQLLVQMEGVSSDAESPVFVIAATNFPWDIDEALLRRFQKRIFVPLPDADARRKIIVDALDGLVSENFDADAWAERLENYSCSDVKNVCRDAAQSVFDRQTDMMDASQFIRMSADDLNYQIIVTNEDFERSVGRIKSSVDISQMKRYEEWRRTKGAE